MGTGVYGMDMDMDMGMGRATDNATKCATYFPIIPQQQQGPSRLPQQQQL